jgi:hypothetical protein
MGSNINKKAFGMRLAEATQAYIKQQEKEKKSDKVTPAYKSNRGWWKK